MSHDDGVVDRRPGAGAGCRCWYTRGSVKREAKAAHGADEDVEAARGAGGASGSRVAWARVPMPRVVWTKTSGPRVAQAGAPVA
jgi:hypothetical protein